MYIHIYIYIDRESNNTGQTVYFANRTGHLKMLYSRIISLSQHNKHTKLHFQCIEIKQIAFSNVLCVL